MSKNQPISLGDLGQKLGIVGSVSKEQQRHPLLAE